MRHDRTDLHAHVHVQAAQPAVSDISDRLLISNSREVLLVCKASAGGMEANTSVLCMEGKAYATAAGNVQVSLEVMHLCHACSQSHNSTFKGVFQMMLMACLAVQECSRMS